jgi:hypothetical protein
MPYTLIFSIEDEKNKSSTMEIKLDDSHTLAQVITIARGLGVLIDGLIRGVVRGVSASFGVTLPNDAGMRTSALTGSDVEEGGRAQFITDGGYRSGFRIPTMDEAFIDADGSVDLTDADVQAFVSAMLGTYDLDPDAGTQNAIVVDSRGDDYNALAFFREQFLSSRGSR